MDSLKISIPPIPQELRPNTRPHVMAKAKQAKWYREKSRYEAVVARTLMETDIPNLEFPWTAAVVRITHYNKTARVIDRDNIIASMKSAFDGLEDAGVVLTDADLIHLPVIRDYSKFSPRVEIEVFPLRDELDIEAILPIMKSILAGAIQKTVDRPNG